MASFLECKISEINLYLKKIQVNELYTDLQDAKAILLQSPFSYQCPVLTREYPNSRLGQATNQGLFVAFAPPHTSSSYTPLWDTLFPPFPPIEHMSYTPHSTPVLPFELFGEIIDDLDPTTSEDRAALSALSQANVALSNICQRRIFSQVTISLKTNRTSSGTLLFEDGQTTTQEFLRLLQQSNHLRQYVQGIELWLKVSIFVTDLTEKGHVASTAPSFALYTLFPLLHNLKRFVVKAPGWSLPWSGLEGTIRGFFSGVANHLEDIDLRPFYGIPTWVFSHSPVLRKLHVSKLHVETKSGFEFMGPKTCLEFLEIDNFLGTTIPTASDILSWFNPANQVALDLSSLVRLKVIIPDSVSLEGIFALSLHGLRDLDFRLSDWSYGKSKFVYGSEVPDFQTFSSPLDLGTLEDIRSLTIRSIIRHDSFNFSWRFYETDIPFLSCVMKSLPRSLASGFPSITVIIEIHDVPDDLLGSIAWFKLVGELVKSAPDGVLLNLKFEVFDRAIPMTSPKTGLRDAWALQDVLRELLEKKLAARLDF